MPRKKQIRPCSVEECTELAVSRGWCNVHYQRWLKYGDPSLGKDKITEQKHEHCTVEGCNNPTRSKGSPYCEMHYYRIRRNGSLKVVQEKGTGLCWYCGEPLNNPTEYQKFCSHRCSTRYYRNDPVTLECVVCGKSFVPFDRNITCSPECNEQRKRDVNRAWHVRRTQPIHAPRKCAVCGNDFIPFKRNQYLCDKAECKREGACIHNYKIIRAKKGNCICRGCGVEFVPERGRKQRIFCSVECCVRFHGRVSKHIRRARERCVAYESIDPLTVFERDNWTCHICGKKAPARLRGTKDDRAPELDHIVPLARGGAHIWDNVACAHRKCNIMKSDKAIGQMRLPIDAMIIDIGGYASQRARRISHIPVPAEETSV